MHGICMSPEEGSARGPGARPDLSRGSWLPWWGFGKGGAAAVGVAGEAAMPCCAAALSCFCSALALRAFFHSAVLPPGSCPVATTCQEMPQPSALQPLSAGLPNPRDLM